MTIISFSDDELREQLLELADRLSRLHDQASLSYLTITTMTGHIEAMEAALADMTKPGGRGSMTTPAFTNGHMGACTPTVADLDLDPVIGMDEDCADQLHGYCLSRGCTCACHFDPHYFGTE